MKHWKPPEPSRRNLLAESIAALRASVSFDMGIGPRMYVTPEVPGAELTELQLISVAIERKLIELP